MFCYSKEPWLIIHLTCFISVMTFWFSTWLLMGLTKTQTSLFNLSGIFFIGPFEMGRPILNPDHLRVENTVWIWAKPSGGSLYIKGHRRRKLLIYACLFSLSQTKHLSSCWVIPSLVLESTSFESHSNLKTSWGTHLVDWITNGFLDSPSKGSHLGQQLMRQSKNFPYLKRCILLFCSSGEFWLIWLEIFEGTNGVDYGQWLSVVQDPWCHAPEFSAKLGEFYSANVLMQRFWCRPVLHAVTKL